jgi:RNA polymerase sigma factor (sigma-70 family)
MEAPVNSDAREGDQVERPMTGRESLGIQSHRDEAIVFEALTTHAPALLQTARRHSLCADDAHDAYQRALEILLRRAGSLDSDRAMNWLHTVVKHEAMAVRRSRQQLVGGAEIDLDRQVAAEVASPEERALSWEHTTRAAEALKRLKPQERKALWLKASGLSYAEIAEHESWTYTKVNRCLAEGRKSFLARYSGIESGAECDRWAPLLSSLVDGEASPAELADLRPHLRNCPSCRATVRALHDAAPSISVLIPLGFVAGSAGAPSGISSGALTRVWDSLVTTVGDRATSVAIKAQALSDAAAGAKVAVVAATAVAAAGGGVAVVHTNRTHAKPATLRQSPNSAVPVQVRSIAAGVQGTLQRAAKKQAAPTQKTEFGSALSTANPSQVGDEFGPEQAASPTPNSQSVPKPSSAQNGAEFDP